MTKLTRLDYSSQQYAEIEQVNAENQLTLQKLNNSVLTSEESKTLISQILGKPLADSVEIRLPFYTDYGRNIHIGQNVFINSNVMFTDIGGITLADDVLIGPGVSLISVNHPQNPADRHNLEVAPIQINKNAWIGANATILPGVTVGENSIVAAGAVVTHEVPDNVIVAGVPAKVIRLLSKS